MHKMIEMRVEKIEERAKLIGKRKNTCMHENMEGAGYEREEENRKQTIWLER